MHGVLVRQELNTAVALKNVIRQGEHKRVKRRSFMSYGIQSLTVKK